MNNQYQYGNRRNRPRMPEQRQRQNPGSANRRSDKLAIKMLDPNIGSIFYCNKTNCPEPIEIARVYFPCDGQLADNIQTMHTISLAMRTRIHKSM